MASEIYRQCKARRLRRLRRTVSPTLWQALQDGKISLYAADGAAKLAVTEQDEWLSSELERRRRKIEGEHIASSVIMELLAAGVFDLGQIAETIRSTIALGA